MAPDTITPKQVRQFIYQAIRPFPLAIGLMIFIAIFMAIDLSLKPYILKIMLNRLAENSRAEIFSYLLVPCAIYIFLDFMVTTIWRLYGYFVEIKMIPRLRQQITTNIFKRYLKQTHSFYQGQFSGSLTNKINDLSYSVPEIIQIVIDRFIGHILALLVAVFTLWTVSGSFALLMSVWTLVFFLGSLLFSRRLTRLSDVWSEYGSTITGKIVDSLSNILSIRLFARASQEETALTQTYNESVAAERKLQWTYSCMWVINGYVFVMAQALNLYFLMKGYQDGIFSIGDFALVLSINIAIVDHLWQITRDFSQFSRLFGKIMQALRTANMPIDIEDTPEATPLKVTRGEIAFENVVFHYKGTDALFRDKSITIAPGQKVGLVGYSGSGKTTFVNLILRLFDVSSGRITIDGQDIKKVTQDSLHEALGMIPQDPSLFNRTLRENIRYGQPYATDAEIITAAKKAHAHHFIEALPEKYESIVGERGVKLSGGQRQRIAMARTFLKNAPVLILDEATSQLDSITENQIQESLWDVMQGKTVIVIAHRLSTLLHMDRILVFDKGKIVEDGTHHKLLNRNGLYKTLWEAQVGGFLLDE